MSDHQVEQLPYTQDRVLVGGVNGKRVIVLTEDGLLGAVRVHADALAVPRCPVAVIQQALALHRPMSIQELVDRVVGDRRLVRAVWWPGAYGPHGKVISEEAIGVVMLDEAHRQAPTPEEWAAAAGELRLLEGRVRG